MKMELIFVTGFFGAPIKNKAVAVAKEKSGCLLSLDDIIEKGDGRSIQRLCIMMGEHEYRNKEYQSLIKLVNETDRFVDSNQKYAVVYCGDGVLLDDMSRKLVEEHSLTIVGMNMSENELWQNAQRSKNSYHAFMSLEDEKKKRSAFHNLYQRQLLLYNKYRDLNG